MIRVENLEEFSLDLTKFYAKTVPANHLALQKKIALDLLRKIVLRNPVGNPDLWQRPPPKGYVGGRSRANWQVELNVTNENEVEAVDPSGAATITAGTAKILGVGKPYGTIWLFNNVPYIIELEYGWSTQAPNGMVRLSIAEIEAVVK